ncbi:MAG: LysM peptidoglycan-binding domain-containing protein [Planctomycetota bacterium]
MNIEKWAIGILTVVMAVLLGISIFSAENRENYPIRGDGDTSGKGGAVPRNAGPGQGGRSVEFDAARKWVYSSKDKLAPKKIRANGAGKSVPLSDNAEERTNSVRTTKVGANETFSHIAKRIWGDATLYRPLVKANPKLNPRNLRAGQTVIIPPRGGRSAVKNVAVKDEPAPSGKGRFHTVAAHETLGAIARRYYRSENKWKRIFEANRDQLRNPNVVKKGLVLRIP